ncbi:MAG: type II toxin-antitoxin system RatA family toxin [Dongiaceae bacterium]
MPSHTEHRLVPFKPAQMYQLVADIESYPAFLPWCLEAKILERKETEIKAALTVGWKILREKFTSRVLLEPGQKITVEEIAGPFTHLKNEWEFKDHGKGCMIRFAVDFEFRSVFLQGAMQPLFHQAVQRMVKAFEKRAEELYAKQ